MIRTALLNGNNINRDSDFSKYIESISGPGVIEGLEVSASSVAEGYAWISCERSNGETVYPVVYITSPVEISGDGEVYIEVKQSAIDNGELSNEDGTGIAEVKVGTTPSKNAIKLATITGGVVEDNRVFIPKLDNLRQTMETLFASVEDLDDRVEALEEQGAVDHLEESGLVGELYTLDDKMFKQYTPTLENSSVDCNVGDVAANTEIHIQRMGSGVASNQLKLKIKSVGSPTTGLVVEVRKGVQVNVSSTEAYWYGDEVIATGSIAYSDITNTYGEFTITLNNEFGETEGELLDIVVYQTGSIVNASNYYCIACDSTQYSEAFSYVSVNGTTRTRSYLMPYCISDGFAQSLLVKVISTSIQEQVDSYSTGQKSYSVPHYNDYTLETFTIDNYLTKTPATEITATVSTTWNYGYTYNRVLVNGEIIQSEASQKTFSGIITSSGDTITLQTRYDQAQGSITQSKVVNSITLTYGYTAENYSSSPEVCGLPIDIRNIGRIGKINIRGLNNNDFFNGFSEVLTSKNETTTEATVGSITPGNFVGYIKVGDYKIPYYT